MFERFKSFMSGVGQLIRNPNLLEEYQSTLSTANHYHKEAVQDKQRLQEAYGQVNTELEFRKEMESEGIVPGRAYVDTELGPELFLDRPQEAKVQAVSVSVAYIQVTGFAVKGGEKWIETNLGDVRAERFLARKEQGKLVTIEQAARDVDQANTQKQPVTQGQDTPAASVETLYRPGYAELTAQMKEAGYIFKHTSDFGNDFIIWEDVEVGKEFALAGWEDVKVFLDEQKSLCGMLFYPDGGMYRFSDSDQLLKVFAKNLDYMGPNGVFIRTITDDPSVNKAVDDLIYNEFGKDNPHNLDYYAKRQSVPEPEPNEQEAVGLEM